MVHEVPERRWSTTGRPARTGYPYPDKVKASPVSTEAGADSDNACLTTDKVRVTDIPWAAAVVGRATARQDVLEPATPARTVVVNRPVEFVTAETTVDQDDPCRCNHTVRPAAAGKTTPDMTTDSAGAATVGLTLQDTLDATAACAKDTLATGAINVSTAANTTSSRQRDDRPARTPNLPTATLFTYPLDLPHDTQATPTPTGARP